MQLRVNLAKYTCDWCERRDVRAPFALVEGGGTRPWTNYACREHAAWCVQVEYGPDVTLRAYEDAVVAVARELYDFSPTPWERVRWAVGSALYRLRRFVRWV